MDQHARRGALVETVSLEVACALCDRHQLVGNFAGYASLVCDDAAFDRVFRIAEIEGGEALLGRLLEILEQRLVTGL